MEGDSVLVLNAGSSSLKFSLFRTDGGDRLDLVVRGEVEGLGAQPRLAVRDGTGATLVERDLPADDAREPKDAIGLVREWLRERHDGERIAAVGHRVVHGGAIFSRPTLVDDRV